MTCKALEKFIHDSIDVGKDTIDWQELERLLDSMTTGELESFWRDFVSRNAISTAVGTVPYWKTAEQKRCFVQEGRNWEFYPKRDPNGKCIVVREELENHIKDKLSSYIKEERDFGKTYKRLPLANKVQRWLGLIILITAVPSLFCGAIGIVVYTMLLALYVILYALPKRR